MSRPRFLHNMSIRPRQHIAWRVDALGRRLVGFDRLGLETPDDLADPYTPETLADTDRRRLLATLDEAWQGYRLTGAALLYPCASRRAVASDDTGAERAPRPDAWATDPLLIWNVFTRARGHLLMARSEITLEPHATGLAYVTDDPRLVALVAATGKAKGRKRS